MAKRRNFTNQCKAKVALEARGGDKTVQEIAAKHQLHPNQVSTWKRQAIDGMVDGFQARHVIKNWMTFYNTERSHSALDRQTPDDAYWAGLEQQRAA